MNVNHLGEESVVMYVTGFVKTVPIGTTIEIHFMATLKLHSHTVQVYQAHGYR